MTLRELAAALGYTAHGYVNAVEQGKKKPLLDLVLKVADVFDVTPDQLLRDELEVTTQGSAQGDEE